MKKKIVQSLVLFFMTAALIIGAAGCGSKSTSGKQDSSSYELSLPNVGTSTTGLDSIAIGIEKGFFKEQNITIKPVGNVNIPQYVAAVSSGTITGALLMTSDGLAAIDAGADLVQVATDRDATEKVPHMNYVVLKDSPITNGKQLVGKNIGVSSKGGCTAGFPLEYAAQAGVDNPKAKLEFTVAPEVSLVDALRKGEVDVVGLHSNPAAIAKLYPDVRILFSDYTIFKDKGGDIAWFFPQKYIDKNPEAVKGFVAALAKTTNWINANNAEAQELYFKINPNVNKDLFNIPHFAENALIQESHTKLWLDVLGSGNSIQTTKKKLAYDEVATNKFNPYAK